MHRTIQWKKTLPHLGAILVFLAIAVIYGKPIFQGKVLDQSDIAGWMGMVHQMQQYKAIHGHFPLWNTNMFGGMPAYQIALESSSGSLLGWVHNLLTLFLPAPVSFFFLLCLSFYFLTQVLKIRPLIGILSALIYGYVSFNAILVSAGHETEIQAMGYVPFLLGSMIILYEGNYWWGATLTTLFSALLVGMNHPQISYYFLIVVSGLTVTYMVQWLRNRQYKHLALTLCLAAGSGVLGAMANATSLLTTYEYSLRTNRNGSLIRDSSTENTHGLPMDYAFQWSYGRAETLSLLVPNVYGGVSASLPKDSRLAQTLKEQHMPSWERDQFFSAFDAYWGDQPGTSGPIYLGAIVCFLFLFGCLYGNNKHKAWLISLTAMAILMAWGRHFPQLNNFLFRYLPLYNKFRAPSMILFIPQLTVPMMVGLSLQQCFYGQTHPSLGLPKLRIAVLMAALLLSIGLILYTHQGYLNAKDLQRTQYLTQINKVDPKVGAQLLSSVAADRKALFGKDLLRSLAWMGAAALLLSLYMRGWVKKRYVMAGLCLFVFVDLIGVDTRYLSYGSYLNQEESDISFAPTQADLQISKDTSSYRVLNLSEGLTNAFQESGTSYFHRSLGGYHPAPLALIQDLINYQLNKEPLNQSVLNMFNTKYVLMPKHPSTITYSDESTQAADDPLVVVNPTACGPVWFVQHLQWVKDPNESMRALDHFNPEDTAIVEQYYSPLAQPSHSPEACIRLDHGDNDQMDYTSRSPSREFAVFSEIYYPEGWKAYIDGKETAILRVDYALRGLEVPPGKHQIEFAFHPASYYMGEKIASISNWLMILLIAGTLGKSIKEYLERRRSEVERRRSEEAPTAA
jgi:hypothetical protein